MGNQLETYMASLGYIVVCVDGRGTGGRGEAFEKCTYLKIGVKKPETKWRPLSISVNKHTWIKTGSVFGDGATADT